MYPMQVWQKYKTCLWQIGLALAVGGASALLSGSQATYAGLVKPPLSPPGWVFPVVWTVLYILMGIAAGLIHRSDDVDKERALTLYYIQLFINFLWSPLFFGWGCYSFAAIWLLLLVVAVFATWRRFRAISPSAGWLLVPYLLWCLFALYFNIGFVVLN